MIAGAMGVVAIVEVVGGLVSGSLALLADAAHASTDVLSVLLALFATHVALRAQASSQKSFGYYRAEILAAFTNAVLLAVLAVFLIIEAVDRYRSPQPIDGWFVVWFALAIAVAEVVGLVLLHRAQGESLSLRSAFLHLLGDLVSTVGVAVGGLVIHFYGVLWVDPLLTVGIAGLIGYWAYRLLSDTGHILMEGTPTEIRLDAVREAVRDLDGVQEIHDLHVWTLTSGVHSMTAHLVADHCDPRPSLALGVRERLASAFGIEHVTLQLEDPCHPCGERHD